MAAAASCFGDYGVEVSSTSSGYRSSGKPAAAAAAGMNQSSVSCLYRTKLAGQCRVVTVTWSKSVMGHSLSVGVDDGKIGCKVELRPWLFWKRHGSKTFFHVHGDCHLELFWDLSSAKFAQGPEPVANFLVAIVCDNEILLELGDRDPSSSKNKLSLNKETLKRLRAAKPAPIQAALVSRREHLYGKKFFTTKASFCEGGELHEVIIECPTLGSYRSCPDEFHGRAGNSTSASGSSTGLSSGSSSSSGHSSSSSRSSGGKAGSSGCKEPRLCIRIDRKVVVQVKRLAWKFRGNQTIVVDGQQVEVFWDVHNWLFSGGGGGGGGGGGAAASPANAAVFMFQMCSSGNQSKPWQQQQPQQRETSSAPGFSLFLYACKND